MVEKLIKDVREIGFYKEAIEEKDIEELLDNISRHHLPFLGIFNLGWLFYRFPKIFIKKVGNTFHMYIENRKEVKRISHLLFPFRLGTPEEVQFLKGRGIPGFTFASGNFVEFMLKGGFEELHLRVHKVLGRYIMKGVAINEEDQHKTIFFADLVKFLKFNLLEHPSIYIEILQPLLKSFGLKSNEPLFQTEDISIGLDNFDPTQHTLVVGESGSGKSVFLMMYILALLHKYGPNIRLIVIDPHGEFKKKLHINGEFVVDYIGAYIDPVELPSANESPMYAQLITQLIMSTLGSNNKYAERVAFHSVYLLLSIGKLDLANLKALLVDELKRGEFLAETDKEELKVFFDNEYNDIYTSHFNEAILPVINFISEYLLHMSKEGKQVSITDLLKKHRLVVISFDPNRFSKNMIKFLSGSIMNAMYIEAITGKISIPTLLIVDEFPRVANPVLTNILAETRKFNLFAVLATQYLSQLPKDILDAVISNVRNIVAFKLHKKDAELLSGAMNMKIEEYFLKNRSTTELEMERVELFVRLHTREAVVRLFDGEKYFDPMVVKTVDANNWFKYMNQISASVETLEEASKTSVAKGTAKKRKTSRNKKGNGEDEAQLEESEAEENPFKKHTPKEDK